MALYELWLDESGSFDKDDIKNESPSLVGGILITKGILDEYGVKRILKQEYVHSVEMKGEEYGDYAIDVLNNSIEKGADFVIFENEERINILNGDTTYLNIISEGIIQLLQYLSLKEEHVELDILIAVRKVVDSSMDASRHVIQSQEYIDRLKEKIIIGMARRSLKSIGNSKWNVKFASARVDARLMLADVVCHSWFRRNSRKFNEENRKVLLKLYKPQYYFTAFERATSAYVNRLLSEGNIGDAIFELYTVNDEKLKEHFLDTILTRLSISDEITRKVQLMNLVNKIQVLIILDRNLEKSREILEDIQYEFIEQIKAKEINANYFVFDIYLLLLTVAEHQGDTLTENRQINLCSSIISNMTKRWESLDYFYLLKIRQAVHQNNIYDYLGCIENMNSIEKLIDETMGLYSLTEEFSTLCNEIVSDIKGKVLGTRLQSRAFLIRIDKGQIELARKDSDRAIEQFEFEMDKSRQYQYRCQIECEAREFIESIKWLYKSVGLTLNESNNFDELAEKIKSLNKISAVFTTMHYLRILSEASISGEISLAEMLYSSWNKAKLEELKIIKEFTYEHPYQIIYWKIGTYLLIKGSVKSGLGKYKIAINICNKNPKFLTLRSIGLGIQAELAALLCKLGDKYSKEYKEAYNNLIKDYNNFIASELPESMKIYFMCWREDLENVKNTKSNEQRYEILLKLSRSIAY